MNWTEQAETMMKTWTEAQKKIWEGWFDVAQSGAGRTGGYPNMMDQWRWFAEQGMQSWTTGTGSTAKGVIEQMMTGQEAMMRFLKLSTNAWQAMAPKLEAGEDWQAVVKEYSNQWFQQLVGGPVGVMAASKDLNEQWRFYMEEMQKLSQPWLASWNKTPWHFGQAMMGGGSELTELTNLHWDAFERTFGRMTESPHVGFNREVNAKLLKGFDAFVDFRRASADYHILLGKVWTQAFERVMQELVTMSEKGEKIDSVRQLMNLWFETIDTTFTETYRSEEYLRIQKAMSATGMTYRIKEQEVIETFMKMSNLPTRSELDDAYRRIYELRKDVKALKKAMHAADGPDHQVKSGAKKSAKRKQAGNETSEPEAVVETITDANGSSAQ